MIDYSEKERDRRYNLVSPGYLTPPVFCLPCLELPPTSRTWYCLPRGDRRRPPLRKSVPKPSRERPLPGGDSMSSSCSSSSVNQSPSSWPRTASAVTSSASTSSGRDGGRRRSMAGARWRGSAARDGGRHRRPTSQTTAVRHRHRHRHDRL